MALARVFPGINDPAKALKMRYDVVCAILGANSVLMKRVNGDAPSLPSDTIVRRVKIEDADCLTGFINSIKK